jgi:hypothetical protein
MNDVKLPFGLKADSNKMVHVSDVDNGKRCDCICPACRIPLIAAKGKKLQHHFRHYNGDECEEALERAIYLAAKQLIMEKKQLMIPETIIKSSKFNDYRKYESQQVQFDTMQEKVNLHGVNADILATKGGVPLIIKISYRHKVEDDKILKILKGKNISAIEIDLSNLTWRYLHDCESFYSLINDPKNIKWLYNAKGLDDIKKKLEEELDNIL